MALSAREIRPVPETLRERAGKPRIGRIGRIGMDVVRAAVERFNGTAEVHSNPGKGTRVVMEFPTNPVAGVPSR